MDASDRADRNERHRLRMEKKKTVVDAKIAQAVEERGAPGAARLRAIARDDDRPPC